MNKILPYVIVAILLGTATMIIPYVLIRSSDYTSLTDGDELIQPSTAEPTTETEQGRAFSEGEDAESSTLLPADKLPAEQPAAETTASILVKSLSNLFPMALITITSFLIALGAFIYLKKRRI